ncbi:mechanosensitive ion channel family protein [Hellea balneolensis]|uniref:mechanosensitive ion channel family protein n=1 Tax=Hellea balneolensis TaxID=287478 RepID=UPI0004224921|nr:mechanosensitive ion channel domain-containing protein [Hellea balneolensis]
MDVSNIISVVLTYAVPVALAVITFWLGAIIASKISTGVEKGFNRSPQSDPSLSRFFASIVRYLILIAVIIAALTILGINTNSITGVILGLGAAMAFILQDSLANIAAGVMLMFFRPYKLGDEIEVGGEAGKVTSIELTATRLKTTDNIEIIIANGNIWGSVLKNYSSLVNRRLDMDFGISYDADIDTAIKAITTAAAAHPLVLKDPAPWAKVVLLNESSVDLQLRAWCKASDYRALKASISQPVKTALDAANIGIPYPHEIKIKIKTKPAPKKRASKSKPQSKKMKKA